MKFIIVMAVTGLVTFGSTGWAASVTFTSTSDKHYSALPESADVRVFASDKDIQQHYEVLGIIELSAVGKFQNITLEKALPAIKKKARELGVNAVIIDQSTQTKSGIFSRGIDVRVRAIRLSVKPPH